VRLSDEKLHVIAIDIRDAGSFVERDSAVALLDEVNRLRGLINTPETEDFLKALPLEAAHQAERWGPGHDDGKTPWDWFWALGYLGQKAAMAALSGDIEKAKHHTISSAALLLTWHRRMTGWRPDA
jgi:hypothetical protein